MRLTSLILTSVLAAGTLACGSSTPESTSTVQAENVSVRLEGKHKIPVFELGNWTSSIYIASSASNHLEGARPAILKQIVVPNNGFKKTAVPGTYKVQLKKGQFLHIGSYDAFFDIGTGYLRENWLQEVIEIKNDELLVRSANTLVGTNTQDTPLNVGKQSSVLSTFGAAGVVTYRYLGKQTIEVTIPNYTAPLEF